MPRDNQHKKRRKHAPSPAEQMQQIKLDIERAKLAKLNSALPESQTPEPTTFANMIPPTDPEIEFLRRQLNIKFHEALADALAADEIDPEALERIAAGMKRGMEL